MAQVDIEQGYASIERAQRLRVIKVTADVEATVTNANEVRMALTNTVLPRPQNLYQGLRYTLEGEGKEQKESLGDVLTGFAIALLAISLAFGVLFGPLVTLLLIPCGYMILDDISNLLGGPRSALVTDQAS